MKQFTGGRDIGRVYLDLLSRHLDSGIVELGSESEHAYSCGYTGTRAVRSWRERMSLLEELGFIKTHRVANQHYKLVLLVDPLRVVCGLRNGGRIPDDWWEAYTVRLLETKESDDDEIGRALEETRRDRYSRNRAGEFRRSVRRIQLGEET